MSTTVALLSALLNGSDNSIQTDKDTRDLEALIGKVRMSNRAALDSAEADYRKCQVLNAALSAENQERPLATADELDELRKQLRIAQEMGDALNKCVERMADIRSVIARRDAERDARKVAKKKEHRHCQHCGGHASKCSCKYGCVAPAASKCFIHCEHCAGKPEKPCKCTEDKTCVRKAASRCTAKAPVSAPENLIACFGCKAEPNESCKPYCAFLKTANEELSAVPKSEVKTDA